MVDMAYNKINAVRYLIDNDIKLKDMWQLEEQLEILQLSINTKLAEYKKCKNI